MSKTEYTEYFKTLDKRSVGELMEIVRIIAKHQGTFGVHTTEHVDFLYAILVIAKCLVDEALEDKN